jgi:hypothetical protein
MGVREMCIVSGELRKIGWFATSFTSSLWEHEFKKVQGKKIFPPHQFLPASHKISNFADFSYSLGYAWGIIEDYHELLGAIIINLK